MLRQLLPTLILCILFPVFALAGSKEPLSQETYRIGPGDLIDIKVFEVEGLNQTVRVTPEGTILFPLLGAIKVEGLTEVELKNLIESLLEKKYIRRPQVGIFVKESGNFFVLGRVKEPGSFPYRPGTNLSQAIALVGGFSEGGEVSEILITRKEDTFVVNYGENVPIEREDVIFVKEPGKVFVGGYVRQPREVILKPGTTLTKAIFQAGSFEKEADYSEVQLFRKGEELQTIDVDSIFAGKSEDPPLKEGDAIFVQEAKNFFVDGYVRKPGAFPYKKGITLLEAISYAGGIDDAGKPSKVQIIRRKNNGFEMTIVNYKKMRSGKTNDILIEKDDIVYVPRSYLASFVRGLFFSLGLGGGSSVGVNPSPWVVK